MAEEKEDILLKGERGTKNGLETLCGDFGKEFASW